MTLEEALAKITTLEVEVTKLSDQVKNQNSYITKLEGQVKQPSTPQGVTGNSLDPITKKYLEKNMMRDTIAEARANIISQVGDDIYNAIEPDLKSWLDKNMTIQTCTTAFVEDSFNLIYGRCFRNKEHKIHQVLGKGSTPQATPVQPAEQISPNVLINTPPVITNKDGTISAVPNQQGQKTKRDIFSDLTRKVSGAVNPFQ